MITKKKSIEIQIPLTVTYCMLFCLISDTEWVLANQELCDRQGYVVRGLPVGEKINFRVVAVNIAGRSPPATLQQPVTIREIVGESIEFISPHIIIFYNFLIDFWSTCYGLVLYVSSLCIMTLSPV